MAGRHTRFLRTAGANRRRTGWDDGPSTASGSISAAGSALWSTGIQNGDDGITLVRVRGEVLLFLSTVTSNLDGFIRVAVGLAIVTTAAATVGITAVPTPLTDIEYEGWLWHWTGPMIGVVSGGDSALGMGAVRVPIDSKAMRKWNTDETLIGVVEVGSEVGTAVLGFNASSRILVKLA